MSWPASSTRVCDERASPSTVEDPALEKETRDQDELDVPWQVVVHNDPVNLMSYVTMVFQRVFGYPREKAERHMLEVHHNGRSILWSGMRERAELYVQQLHGYLLLATIERI
jgi:ATP-dependent Clp protease adaptor protein ClpS